MPYARKVLGAVALTVLVAAVPSPAHAAPPTMSSRALYLVQVDGAPVASYAGGVAGIPRTKPSEGAKIDKKARNYEAYRQFLRVQRADVLRAAGIDQRQTVAEYTTAFNGFAAALSLNEVAALRATRGVVRVWKNEIRHVDTVSTPAFLGLAGEDGAWKREFGDPKRAGEGVIVGVIDTGYWPESPSLAALPEPRPDQATIDAKWFADGIDKCDEGTEAQIACDNKVIGARYYNASGLGDWAPEFTSPRDYDGHGTHTASTAAGDNNIPATINHEAVGNVSGMAPAARLAIYKALWRQSTGDGSGGTVDLVKAIDDAVTDGVDVINYSVSGSSTYVVDPVEIAFFNAAAAGVFVAASAGNSGPEVSTVAHNSPWTMTVAASSHDRGAVKSATLGNGKMYQGVGQGNAVPSSPLVDAVSVGLAAADPTEVELCYPGTLDPAKVHGKIVLCKRGVNARTDKSIAVRDAGGVGMILYNPTLNSLNADFHIIPTVHVGQADGAAIKAYIASVASPTAALSVVSKVTPRAPEMAAFSSAGPALAAGGDLLKPDITAPGVDIIAAVSPAGHHDNLFDGISGTSMSSPHIAGIAALVRSAHPSWSPSAVKSALMTTASQQDNSGGPIQRAGANATPLDFGAGHVRPPRAFDPGLVYDSGAEDWIRFSCGIGQMQLISDWCTTTGSIDPSNLNYPSIAIGDLPGEQTVTRTVTNVTGQASVYVAAAQAPPGFTVKVTPTAISVPAGRSVSFTVRFTRTYGTYNTWSFGSLTWTDLRGHAVRSPLAVRPVAMSRPSDITGTGISGSATIAVRGGYRGVVTARPFGLAASTVETAHLVGSDHTFKPTAPAASSTVHKFSVTVPVGTKTAQFATYAKEHAPNCDIDLYVYRAGALVGQSVGGTADESVTVNTAGSYDVYVVQYALPDGVTEQDVKAHAFVVGPTAAGNLDPTPTSQRIEPSQTVSFAVAWHGLTAGRRYLGVVELGDGTTTHATTLVTIAP
jgi:subtilisin family serine protease